MDAAVVRKLGNSPRCEQFPEPAARDGELIVHVHAASLKPVDRQLASGVHYAAARELPFISGTDGVGHLDDGQRVFFGGCRPPHGAMAQRTVVPRRFVFPVPDGLEDEIAAALPNPAVSTWLALTVRAKLSPGENVLILGATGIAGRLAVRIARLLGAGRVIAAGRDQSVLDSLRQQGADATIQLTEPSQDLQDSFLREAGDSGFQVVIDYVWGRPTEVLLSALTKRGFAALGRETRLVQVGESAGPIISLPAAVLRSTTLTILGTAGIPSRDVLAEALQNIMDHALTGELHVDTTAVPLSEVETAWTAEQRGRRTVIVPRQETN